MALFRNFYECPCGVKWYDEWSCTCDDRCPACDTSCSPTISEDLPLGATVRTAANEQRLGARSELGHMHLTIPANAMCSS
jgi:hypothetical protein